MKKIGIVFPGQGSQKVGMGQDLIDKDLETQALFEDILSFWFGNRAVSHFYKKTCPLA